MVRYPAGMSAMAPALGPLPPMIRVARPTTSRLTTSSMARGAPIASFFIGCLVPGPPERGRAGERGISPVYRREDPPLAGASVLFWFLGMVERIPSAGPPIQRPARPTGLVRDPVQEEHVDEARAGSPQADCDGCRPTRPWYPH